MGCIRSVFRCPETQSWQRYSARGYARNKPPSRSVVLTSVSKSSGRSRGAINRCRALDGFSAPTAFTSLGRDRRAAAQSNAGANETNREPITLQWKLAEGETLYYEQSEEQTRRETMDGQHLDFKDRRYYLYRWDVLADNWPMSPDGVPMSTVFVSFGRILHESGAPERTILTDTCEPSDARRFNAEANQMQDDAFRMLRSSFVFFATPSETTALPGDLVGSRSQKRCEYPIQSNHRVALHPADASPCANSQDRAAAISPNCWTVLRGTCSETAVLLDG